MWESVINLGRFRLHVLSGKPSWLCSCSFLCNSPEFHSAWQLFASFRKDNPAGVSRQKVCVHSRPGGVLVAFLRAILRNPYSSSSFSSYTWGPGAKRAGDVRGRRGRHSSDQRFPDNRLFAVCSIATPFSRTVSHMWNLKIFSSCVKKIEIGEIQIL